jgi:polysaccharide deacetylase 2 family uncharacterized protein YibQ
MDRDLQRFAGLLNRSERRPARSRRRPRILVAGTILGVVCLAAAAQLRPGPRPPAYQATLPASTAVVARLAAPAQPALPAPAQSTLPIPAQPAVPVLVQPATPTPPEAPAATPTLASVPSGTPAALAPATGSPELSRDRAGAPVALPPAQIQAKSAEPRLAVPDSAGLPPWIAYALPAPVAETRPMIAVVLDDMGLDRKHSAKAVNLPGPLTLSFMTYAQDLAQQTTDARLRGHELMLHVPMEPVGKVFFAGPNALLTSDGAADIQRKLAWDLDRFKGYVGINNHMGSKFTADAAGMTIVMAELKRRGLLFLDSKTTSDTVGLRLAGNAGVPHVGRDIFLDNQIDEGAIQARLTDLEFAARRRGAAIAIGHPHEETIAALIRWLPTLPAKGLSLVPLTAIVKAGTPSQIANRHPNPDGEATRPIE